MSIGVSNNVANKVSDMEWDKFTFGHTLDAADLMSDLISIEAYKQSVLHLVHRLIQNDHASIPL